MLLHPVALVFSRYSIDVFPASLLPRNPVAFFFVRAARRRRALHRPADGLLPLAQANDARASGDRRRVLVRNDAPELPHHVQGVDLGAPLRDALAARGAPVTGLARAFRVQRVIGVVQDRHA